MPAGLFRRRFGELAWTQWMKTVADDHMLAMTAEPDRLSTMPWNPPAWA